MNKDGYGDLEDIKCPKCDCEDFEWIHHRESCENHDIWTCECTACGHKFTVIQESQFKAIDDME